MLAYLPAALVVASIYGLFMYAVGIQARRKGRDPVPFILLSLIVSPLVVMFMLYLLPPEDGSGPWRGAST